MHLETNKQEQVYNLLHDELNCLKRTITLIGNTLTLRMLYKSQSDLYFIEKPQITS